MSTPSVSIIMGSDSDYEVMKEAAVVLKEFDISCEIQVMSAHRSPSKVSEYISGARERGVKVIIAGAGGAAHLAGVAAAHTTLPVIGVPLSATDLNGLDALLATVQMPPGIPVATVAIGKFGSRNAGILAAQIMAVSDSGLSKKLDQFKIKLAQQVDEKNKKLQDKIKA
ncbi:MAG: 5-(carboxyamino)imidazole ribonucleotide mutase [Candidatus Omnitrophica bacterium]|nr:5-(carboxyamino)imidazole ribonucleotide mutase [Candidatus Omnitrophota bacterium]